MKNPKMKVTQYKIVATTPNTKKVVSKDSPIFDLFTVLYILIALLVISVLRDLLRLRKAKPTAPNNTTSTNNNINYTYTYIPKS